MNDRLFDALEICLTKLDEGQTVDAALGSFPDLEVELRPILEASLQAQTLAVSSVSGVAQRRGRARLLKRAAELRKSRPVSSKRMLSLFPRMALALGLAGGFILSSTGLVSASSNSLPGDQLYPVKRTWEDVQLALVFNQQGRETLQSQFEQERLDEIDELLSQNRSQPVTFSGLLIQRRDGKWLVSGIPVVVTDKTHVSAGNISNSVPLQVSGITRSDGLLEAEEVQSLQPGAMLPPLEPSEKGGFKTTNPTPVAVIVPVQTETSSSIQTPIAPPATPQSFTFSGIVQKKEGTSWTINGQTVSVDQADINGSISVGDAVKFEGYYADNGNFMVINIEPDAQGTPTRSTGNKGSGSSGGDSNGGGGGEDGGGKGGGGDG